MNPQFQKEPVLDPRDSPRFVRYSSSSGKRPPVESGPATLRYLDHGELALAQHFLNLKSAKKSIAMTYFEWDPCDTVTKVLTKILEEKAKKLPPGSVRLLIDAHPMDAKTRMQLQEYLRRKGIAVRFYNLDPLRLDFRSHAKLALVDDEKFISGGRNMQDDYFGLAEKNWVDRDVYVEGPQAREAKYGFDDLWNHRGSQKAPPGISMNLAPFSEGCAAWGNREQRLWEHLSKNAQKIVSSAPMEKCEKVRFLIDDPATSRNKPVTSAVNGLLSSAQRSIAIENYSYIPTQAMERTLKEKRNRSIPIKVFSNRFTREDSDMVRYPHSYFMDRDSKGSQTNYSLSRLGELADSWRFTPENATFLIHAKTFAVDGKDAIISSFNIDARSSRINVESAVEVKSCPKFVNHVTRASDGLGRAWKMDQDCEECRGGPQGTILDPGLQWLLRSRL